MVNYFQWLILPKLWWILKHYFTNVSSHLSPPPPSVSSSHCGVLSGGERERVVKPSWLNINVLITGILITSQLLLPTTLLLSLSLWDINNGNAQQSISHLQHFINGKPGIYLYLGNQEKSISTILTNKTVNGGYRLAFIQSSDDID